MRVWEEQNKNKTREGMKTIHGFVFHSFLPSAGSLISDNGTRSLFGSVLSITDALQGVPIDSKTIRVFLSSYTKVLLLQFSSGLSEVSPLH